MRPTPKLIKSLMQPPCHGTRFEPDWRWNRAVALSNRFEKIPDLVDRADPVIATAGRFHAEHLRNRPTPTFTCPPVGEIQRAYAIWSFPELHETRWTLEAFLLSDAPSELIAKHCDRTVEVIRLYEALFYDIRELLKYRLWLQQLVLEPLFPLVGTRREARLKVLAWICGVDMLIRALQPKPRYTSEQKAKLNVMVRKALFLNLSSTIRARDFA
jgi:hypothetical protein